MGRLKVNRFSYKKIIIFILFFIFIINNNYVVLYAFYDKDLILEDYNSEIDNTVKAYICDNVSDEAILDNNFIYTNFIEMDSTSKSSKKSFRDIADINIYTFNIKKEDELIIETVVDIQFKEINISKSDLLELCINDYLRPVDKGRGKLLTKSSLHQEWVEDKEIYVIVNGSIISLYGSELYNNQKFTRILFSFSGHKNFDSTESIPRYTVTYINQRNFWFVHRGYFIIGFIFIGTSTVLIGIKVRKGHRYL